MTEFIAYGANQIPNIEWDEKYLPSALKDGVTVNPSYWLVVARLEPENNIHTIVDGYIKSDTKKPLVIVGNFLSAEYEKTLNELVNRAGDDKNIIFTGGIYNQTSLNMLRQNCFGYLHGHSVGGTNPSLIEAMAMETVILAHQNQFNDEVCDNTALYFNDSEELMNKINNVDKDPEKYKQLKLKALERVKKEYSWEKIVSEYHELFLDKPKNHRYSGSKLSMSAGNSK